MHDLHPQVLNYDHCYTLHSDIKFVVNLNRKIWNHLKRPNCLSFQSYVLKVSFFVNHLIDTIYVRHTYDNLHSYINLEMVCQQTQHSSYACLPNLTFIMLSSQTICKWV